jgi:hypothetical protein
MPAAMSLFSRKQCWVPTLRGWLLLLGIALAIGIYFIKSVDSFLSVNRPVAAEVLVVESWLPDYAYRGAVEEFQRGKYKYIITTGFTLAEPWLESKYKNAAEFGAANLAAMGVQTNAIIALPAPPEMRDRTYLSALPLRPWLDTRTPPLNAVNVYTLGAHARRTRLLFEKAVGKNVKVGVFAHPDKYYDAKHWWLSSYGFRKVMDEGIAYLYARLLFHP